MEPIYKEQETCRISPDDLQLIHENYEEITGDIKRIPIGRFIPMAVVKAVQISKAKEIPDARVVAENETLKNQLAELQKIANSNGEASTGLQFQNESLQKQLNDKTEELEGFKNVINENTIALNYDPKILSFLKGCLMIYQRDKLATNFEEMFWSIIQNFRKQGYLNFDANDIEYIKQQQKPVE